MGFLKQFWPSKVFNIPCLAVWGGLSVISSLLLLPLLPGKVIASTHGPVALWQSLWLGCHKMVAALSVLGLPGLGALILLIIGWGMLFCGCLNSGLGQRADFFLPHFKPSWAAKFGLGAMRSVVALFALGTGVLLFVIPALLVLAAISFWPDALMTGILVLILWTIICVVYIFPCIWADVLIVCHSPLPAQWPSNELYHRFLGAVTSHWTITRFFIISIGVAGLLAGLTYFSGQWSFRVGGRGLWLVVQSAGIFILGLTSLGLAYYFGRHVRQHASTALDIIADGR